MGRRVHLPSLVLMLSSYVPALLSRKLARLPCRQLPCDGCPSPAVGRLAPELAQLENLQTLNLRGNAFYGELPDEWGDNGTFPNLLRL